MAINDAIKMMMENGAGDPLGFGLVPGYRRIAALGNVSASAVGIDVWHGGTVYPFMTVASTMEAVSTSASDASSGIGALTLLVNGLDPNYNEISETVTLNGLTPVALTKTYIAINSSFVTTAGSNHTNVGDILIRDSGGGTTRALVEAGYSVGRSSVYTVPAGYTLSEISMFACVNRQAGGGQINYITVSTGQRLSNGVIRLPLEFTVSSGAPYRHDAEPGIITTEKNSFFLRITAQSAVVDFTAAWLGKLKKNVI